MNLGQHPDIPIRVPMPGFTPWQIMGPPAGLAPPYGKEVVVRGRLQVTPPIDRPEQSISPFSPAYGAPAWRMPLGPQREARKVPRAEAEFRRDRSRRPGPIAASYWPFAPRGVAGFRPPQPRLQTEYEKRGPQLGGIVDVFKDILAGGTRIVKEAWQGYKTLAPDAKARLDSAMVVELMKRTGLSSREAQQAWEDYKSGQGQTGGFPSEFGGIPMWGWGLGVMAIVMVGFMGRR